MSIRRFLSRTFHFRPRGSELITDERAVQLYELQDRISYHFKDLSLLQEALTHRSIKVERGTSVRTNTRLEVLGDSILGLIVTEHLYQKFPSADKGELSARRAAMVSNDRLNEIGSMMGLIGYIEIGSSIQNQNEGKAKYIVADAVESLIAAIYLDGGEKAARSFVKREMIERGEG
ncbi:MAG: hypothetical protein MIO90_05405 [Methanomassiliicoccales archaeon]|nr:hypothetical protein [Methanomassiliicoccales archaeon]